MTDSRVFHANLLAEAWKRSRDDTTRRLGADLADVLKAPDGSDGLAAGFNRPARVTTATLLGALEDMAGAIADGDSAEGFVEYEWSDEAGFYDARCRYRVGSSMGQGGLRVLQGETP